MILAPKNLIIGSAQFGTKYGVSTKRVTNFYDTKKIFNISKKNNLSAVDTAYTYFKSNKILKKIDLKEFKIYTKYPSLSSRTKYEKYYENYTFKTLDDFKKQQIECVFFHEPMKLLSLNGEIMYDSLIKLKNKKLIKKIGISVYFKKEIKMLQKYYDFDVVQVPVNVFDREFSEVDFLKKLKSQKIEIHARSIFLQGLLLLPKKDIPIYFSKWSKFFERWYDYLYDNKISALEACIEYVKNQKYLDKVVIGINSSIHLEEIINTLRKKKKIIIFNKFISDKKLTKPILWQK